MSPPQLQSSLPALPQSVAARLSDDLDSLGGWSSTTICESDAAPCLVQYARNRNLHGDNEIQSRDAVLESPFKFLSSSIGRFSRYVVGYIQTARGRNEPIQDGELRPRHLESIARSRLTNLLLALVFIFVSFMTWAAATVYVRATSYSPIDQRPCGYKTADPTERIFQVDTGTLFNLSYAQAKLIDLTWNVLACQLGRVLHGWVLYQLLARVVTWFNEHEGTPYHLQSSLLFDTISVVSSWRSIKTAFDAVSPPLRCRVFLCASVSILYVLSFATIWSAVAGYFQPSDGVYALDNGITISADNPEDLNLCLVADLGRAVAGHSGVVRGPSASSYTWHWTSEGNFDADDFIAALIEAADTSQVSDEYKNLRAYATTKRSAQAFYNVGYLARNVDGLYYDTARNILPWNIINTTADWKSMDRDGKVRFMDKGTHFESPSMEDYLFNRLDGWQSSGVGQIETLHLEEYVGQGAPSFDSESFPPYPASFTADEGVARQKIPLAVPYNSTLWWDGLAIPIAAPFLETGVTNDHAVCSLSNREHDDSPECLCLGDTPLPTEALRTRKLVCVSENSYTWGFSSQLAATAGLLEAVWLLMCVFLWWTSCAGRDRGSQLARHGISGAGRLRNILDMAGAVQAELGPETRGWSDKQLERQMEARKDVRFGYVVEGPNYGVTNIRLRPLSGYKKGRRKVRIHDDAIYG